jgi:hypothetical protein
LAARPGLEYCSIVNLAILIKNDLTQPPFFIKYLWIVDSFTRKLYMNIFWFRVLLFTMFTVNLQICVMIIWSLTMEQIRWGEGDSSVVFQE